MIFWYCTIFGVFLASMSFKKEIHIVVWIVLAIISAFRFEVGTDYTTYVEMYSSITNGTADAVWTNKELGYLMLIHLSNLVGGNAQLVFVVISILTILFFFLTSNKIFNGYSGAEKLALNSIFLVLFFGFIYFQSLNQARQYAALSICFYSLAGFRRRKIFNVTLWIMIAGLFHKSAIFVLLVLPVFYIKPAINARIVAAVIIAGMLRPLLIIKDLYIAFKLPYYGYLSYAEFAEKTTGLGLLGTYVISAAVGLLVLYCRDRNKLGDGYATVAIGALMYVFIRLCALDFEQVNRLANLFRPFVYVLLSVGVLTLASVVKGKFSRQLIICASIFFIGVSAGVVCFSRSLNDESYAHFSINYCIFGDISCPIIISK